MNIAIRDSSQDSERPLLEETLERIQAPGEEREVFFDFRDRLRSGSLPGSKGPQLGLAWLIDAALFKADETFSSQKRSATQDFMTLHQFRTGIGYLQDVMRASRAHPNTDSSDPYSVLRLGSGRFNTKIAGATFAAALQHDVPEEELGARVTSFRKEHGSEPSLSTLRKYYQETIQDTRRGMRKLGQVVGKAVRGISTDSMYSSADHATLILNQVTFGHPRHTRRVREMDILDYALYSQAIFLTSGFGSFRSKKPHKLGAGQIKSSDRRANHGEFFAADGVAAPLDLRKETAILELDALESGVNEIYALYREGSDQLGLRQSQYAERINMAFDLLRSHGYEPSADTFRFRALAKSYHFYQAFDRYLQTDSFNQAPGLEAIAHTALKSLAESLRESAEREAYLLFLKEGLDPEKCDNIAAAQSRHMSREGSNVVYDPEMPSPVETVAADEKHLYELSQQTKESLQKFGPKWQVLGDPIQRYKRVRGYELVMGLIVSSLDDPRQEPWRMEYRREPDRPRAQQQSRVQVKGFGSPA